MRMIVNGAGGRMGQKVLELMEKNGIELAGAVDRHGGGNYTSLAECTGPADVVIDFSSHEATLELMDYCVARNLPVVVATTGHTLEELSAIDMAAEHIPVFRSANMSVGVALLARLVKQAAAIFAGCDVEIVEAHHNRKADAPSGTALLLADAVKSQRPEAKYVCGRSGMGKREPEEIGIHALRMGNVVGQHQVMFATDTQTITLKHEAHDRALFAEGALTAAGFLVNQAPGLYQMEDLLG